MEAYFSDLPVLIKAIQSLQLTKVNKRGSEGQFLTCDISKLGIKFSNSTIGKDVYCCCWLRKDTFKKYKYECYGSENISFNINYTALLNCIQVFGSDAKNLVLTYDKVNLHLNITDDEGSNTDCIICTYHISDNDYISQISDLNPINNSTHFDHVVMFPNVLKDLIKDISDIGRPESLIKFELFPQRKSKYCMMSFSCIVEGEECVWEFSDDHNVFSGSNINKYHCSSYSVKSITQLERSLSVCSLLRIKVNEKGLLVIQMVIKNDNHAIKDIKADDREISGTKDEKTQHIINTEFIIQPVNN